MIHISISMINSNYLTLLPLTHLSSAVTNYCIAVEMVDVAVPNVPATEFIKENINKTPSFVYESHLAHGTNAKQECPRNQVQRHVLQI